jgi:hypothetical protein
MKVAADHCIRRGMFSGGLWVLRDNGGARDFYESSKASTPAARWTASAGRSRTSWSPIGGVKSPRWLTGMTHIRPVVR